MTEVFCNNCGHRNPPESNFCSSCGAVLETDSPENTTITFHPSAPSDPVEDEVGVELGEVPHDVGILVIKRGAQAGARFALESTLVTAGRHPESDIFLDDITVSRRHAELARDGDEYSVRDVGSLNGTYLNRERIDQATLRNGDELQIGKFKLVFFLGTGQAG